MTFYMCALLSFGVVRAVLPPGYEDELFCRQGKCLRAKQVLPGFTGPRSAFHECVTNEEGTDATSPQGWGYNKGAIAREELVKSRWHSTTCEQSEFMCNSAMDSAEWATCQVAGHFLVKMLGELNSGDTKTVAHVRSMLAPYLSGPDGISSVSPVGTPKEFTPKKAEVALRSLYNEIDEKNRRKYETLKIDGPALAESILAHLSQKEGTLLRDDDQAGQAHPPRHTVQRVMFDILDKPDWHAQHTLAKPNSSWWYVGAMLIMGFVLLSGFIVWRSFIRSKNLAKQ